MKIIEKKYNWSGSLTKRAATKYIVLHHRAEVGDADSIHRQHINGGFSGIGYHFYIRKDGAIYQGRPIDTVGAHCIGKNDKSICICFEGNFENEKMPYAQIKAGKELVSYLKGVYPDAEVKRHKDFYATACPGKNFPFKEIKNGVTIMTVNEAIEILKNKAGLEPQTTGFLLCYKYGDELVKKLAKGMK